MLFYPSYAQNETKSMRMYFNIYKQSGGTPSFTLTGDVPTGVTATASDFVWANTYEIFWKRNCSDRILANKSSDERSTNASISFSNMKYEVKEVRWNRMNDIFDNSLTDVFRSLRAFGTVESFTGTKIQGSEATWMVLNKDFTFQKDNFPPNNSNNLALPGLKTLTLNESNSTVIFGSKRKIDDNCRFFLKASDDTGSNDWAFQVTYYEPSLALSGIPSMMFLGQERNFTSGDYSVLHTGAFNFTLESVVSSEPEVISIDANRKMTANNVGSSTITVTMKDGNKVITASKVIDVKTLTPQEGVHYYHDDNRNHNSIDFSELNHTDGDYSFSTSDKTDGDFKCLGVLKSATNKVYKVGAKVIDFPMSAPAYTTVTAPFDFKLTNEQSGSNVWNDFGGEIIITEDYNNLTLITNNSASTGSVYKRWKDFFIGTSQSVANNTTLINNSDKASAVKDKTFHMILMSATDATGTSKTMTTEFYYKVVPSIITYFSYITFDGNGGTITTTSKNQTIANTNGTDGKVGTTNLNNINVASRVGYTFKGWNTEADGTGEFYAPRGAFRPSTVETGGEGRGPVTLYAVWQPNTYTVTLNQAGGSGGTTSVTATFDEPLPFGDDVKAPTRYGYTFGGYFTEQNGAGTMYYDNSMTGVKDWDVAADRTLYAKWTIRVSEVELRPNGTGAVAGTPSVKVTYNQKFPEEVDGHAVTPPTRPGYIFNGFYLVIDNTKKYFYDKDMKTASCANWPYQADYHVLADWIPKTTIVTYDVQGGYDWAATTQPVTFGEPMPYVNTPQRQGYTFAGYYDQPNGQGKKYYDSNNGNAVSATSWDKDAEEATLYAFWEAKSQKVEFHYNNETPEKVVTVDGYKENSPNNSSLRSTTPAVPTPTKDGYIFGGWVDAVINGYLVYDSDGEATEGMYWQTNNGELVWKGRDGNEITRVYPFWVKETVTANVKVIRDRNYEGKDGIHRYVGITISGVKNVSSFVGDGYITVDGIHFLSYTENGGADQVNSVYIDEAPIWHFEPMTVNGKTVYEISTTKNGKTVYLGNKLAQIDNTTGEIQYRPDGLGIQEYEAPKNRHFSIYGPGFLCLDDVNDEQYGRVLHWMENQQDQPWQFEEKGFSAQLRPIMIIPAGNAISGDLNTENIFSMIEDELVPSDPNGAFPYSYNVGKDEDKDVYKGVLYVDMSTLSRVVENDNSLSNFKKAASDNCLFFMPENYTNTALGNNVVCKYGTKYESLTALKVTDQVPFFSPYTFSTGNYTASYTRKYGDNWGSLYIPFNASSNTDSGMTFYELLGADETRLAFQSVNVSIIPANTPLAFYGSGCDFTLTSSKNAVIAAGDIEEQASASIKISEDIKDFVLNHVGTSTSAEWNFNGIRFCKCVYGTEYISNRPEGTDQGLVYYFAGNQFKYVNKTGYVRIMPFRAYFKDPSGGSAKAFSIMAFDEYGATDITNIIDGNANGDGKIYDLLGRRVKTPLKGHVYIIDGKKQMY